MKRSVTNASVFIQVKIYKQTLLLPPAATTQDSRDKRTNAENPSILISNLFYEIFLRILKTKILFC